LTSSRKSISCAALVIHSVVSCISSPSSKPQAKDWDNIAILLFSHGNHGKQQDIIFTYLKSGRGLLFCPLGSSSSSLQICLDNVFSELLIICWFTVWNGINATGISEPEMLHEELTVEERKNMPAHTEYWSE
jgi:hypothetical protein